MNTPSRKLLAAAVAAALFLGGCDRINSWFGSDDTGGDFVQKVEPKDRESVPMLLPDFTALVEREGAAVVNIQASRDPSASGSGDNGLENDPIYEFFKRLVPYGGDDGSDGGGDEFNFGSGFIISEDGYILTNTHVLAGMNNIKVLLNDKREYRARLIGSDTQSDVALLKIEASDLPSVKIGNPKDLKVGEWVAAIGAPFGFDNSVTAGIVSAKGRSLPNENYTPFIQTDVAINPGNSGGPLFNLRGQVVGINSQIYSRSGGFMGISFAIPIDVAMNVAEQLKTTGKVQRGRVGVVIQEVSYDLAKSFGMEKAHGALVSQVLPNSPAAQAGLQVGDIILSVNDEEVKNSSDLPVMVGIMAPGKEITLGIWRKGKRESVKIMLDSLNTEADARNGGALMPDDPEARSFAADELGLTLLQSRSGVVVLEARQAAAQAGLRRGDVIMAVGPAAVADEKTFRDAVTAAGKNIPILVKRGDNTLFLALTLQ
ncbi:serine protease Do [Neisseria sp. HSC-16F19]|nr:DegQ family serine endoprotease [Neisseria sp. HSC-16F19]MCP2040121.1 serine protease Do [Neisseria sp. HSC-16F19]